MSNNEDEIVEELKAENLELKLGAIKKELAVFKQDIHRHLDLVVDNMKDQFSTVIGQTSKTNGSVARALEKIAEIERQDNKTKIAELKLQFEKQQKDTKFWTTLASNKWMYIPVVIAVYALSYTEFRQMVGSIFKIIF